MSLTPALAHICSIRLVRVEGCIIHDQHRNSALDILRSDGGAVQCSSKIQHYPYFLEHAQKEDAALSICRKDLVPALTLILGNFDRCYSKWRPCSPSESDPFIIAGLVYVYELVGGV